MKAEKQEHVIPVAPIDRLIRKTSAERVSEGASQELGMILEELGSKIATRAIDLARHANRSTVKEADIRLAYKQWAE
jgi:DNA-binding protein